MDTERRRLNAIRGELHAIKPNHCADPLPPQPGIYAPSATEPILVRCARRLNNLTNRYPRLKQAAGKVARHVIKKRQRPVNIGRLVKQISFTPARKTRVSIIILGFNKVEVTVRCLQSISSNVPATLGYEVILLDNGSSDATPKLAKIKGLHYVRSSENLGFVGGCNLAASKARGEYLVFLNNDAVVANGWLESLLETLETYPQAGIVGSKIIYPDGRLQEAGGIIFRDGTGNNYGKNDHPDRYQYNYVREVDYCSGASIIIKRSLFSKLKGFDVLYQPAYYEDTDLAFRVRELGYKVVYQPKSVIYHIEGATAGTNVSSGFKKYQTINHEKFMGRWGKLLRSQQFSPDDIYPARDRTHKKSFLIVDEHVPTPDQDSGSVRMIGIIKSLQSLGYKVTFFPNYLSHRGKYTESLQQQGVEVVYGPISFEDFIEAYGQYYDGIMLSRPRIGSYYMDLCQAFCPKAKILYDTVDLHYLRLERQADYEEGKLQHYYRKMSEYHKHLEHHLIQQADTALVVSEYEERLLKDEGYTNVAILSNIHSINEAAYAAGFDERKDVIFVGGFQHLPNIDSIKWFVQDIWPLIQAKDDQIQFHIVGASMPDDLKTYLQDRPNVIIDGYVEDLTNLLTHCRVFVAPMRYGAGVKGKIGQAVEYGMPVVTTRIGAEGMHLQDGASCITADDAESFAAGVLRLYTDKALWATVRKTARKIIAERFSIDQALKSLKAILK